MQFDGKRHQGPGPADFLFLVRELRYVIEKDGAVSNCWASYAVEGAFDPCKYFLQSKFRPPLDEAGEPVQLRVVEKHGVEVTPLTDALEGDE